MNVRMSSAMLGACLLLLPGTGLAQEGETETLEARYQAVIDTLVTRLALSDSVADRFRGVVVKYLHDSEEIFAKHQGKRDRESMETMSKELAEARSRMDAGLEEILTPEEITRAVEIMEELRQRARDADSEGAR